MAKINRRPSRADIARSHGQTGRRRGDRGAGVHLYHLAPADRLQALPAAAAIAREFESQTLFHNRLNSGVTAWVEAARALFFIDERGGTKLRLNALEAA